VPSGCEEACPAKPSTCRAGGFPAGPARAP
jgi:hypothetical protein